MLYNKFRDSCTCSVVDCVTKLFLCSLQILLYSPTFRDFAKNAHFQDIGKPAIYEVGKCASLYVKFATNFLEFFVIFCVSVSLGP